MSDRPLFPLALPSTPHPLLDLSFLQGLTPVSLKIMDSFTALGEEMNVSGYKRVLYDRRNDVYIALSQEFNYIVVVDRRTKLMLCSFKYAYTACGDTHDDDEVVDIVLHSTLSPRPPVEDFFYKDGQPQPPMGGQQFNDLIMDGNTDPDVASQMNQTVAEALIRGAACEAMFHARDHGTITLDGEEDPVKHQKREADLSLLVINNTQRSVYIVRIRLDLRQTATTVAGPPVNQITAKDIISYIDLLPRNTAADEVVVPYSEQLYVWQTLSHRRDHFWLRPRVEDLVPNVLKDKLVIGEFRKKYCGMAVTENGRYFVLLGATAKCWLSPFLTFPVDTQYLLTFDDSAMSMSWTYIAPMNKAFSWDETDSGQPYYCNPTIYDGRFLLMQYDVKSRWLGLKQTRLPWGIPQPHLYNTIAYLGSSNWEGRYIAGVMFPLRESQRSWSNIGGTYSIIWYGYPDEWDVPDPNFEPVYRESYWVRIDTQRITRFMRGDIFHSHVRPQPVAHYYDKESKCGSPLTIQGTDIMLSHGNQIMHAYMNYLAFFEEGPDGTQHPMDSLYFAGVVPGETIQKLFKVRNLSEHGAALQLRLCMSAEKIPRGVTLSVSGFPDELAPLAEAYFTVSLTYVMTTPECADCPYFDQLPTPPTGVDNVYRCCNCPEKHAEPLSSIDIPLSMQYYMVWNLAEWPMKDNQLDMRASHLRLTTDLRNVKQVEDFRLNINFDFIYSMIRNIVPIPPVITSPAALAVTEGSGGTLALTASGTPPIDFTENGAPTGVTIS